MKTQVGFMISDNTTYYMKYNEVLDFCKELCLCSKNKDDFLEFSKSYNYFNPYFDYVLSRLNYIFINPLLHEDTYLRCINNKMYIVEGNKLNYLDIIDIARQKHFSNSYCDIVLASNQELNIIFLDTNKPKQDNYMVDPNGYGIITKSCEASGNHEIASNTILNQLLMECPDLDLVYNPREYSVSFLVNYFGFLRATFINECNLLLGIEENFSDIVKRIKKRWLKIKDTDFYDCSELSKETYKKKILYRK